MTTHEATTVDLSTCDREPIHVPGSIQPHGLLFVVREPDLVVLHATENVSAHLGCAVKDVVGAPLSSWLDQPSFEALRAALAAERPADVPLRIVARGKAYHGAVHRHAGLTFLELEPRADATDAETGESMLRLELGAVQAATTVADLCEAVVVAVRRITGFQRVLLYRFDEEGHGAVLAETKDASLDSYLGLHYPASDIPRQARELYVRNWLRLIPDARYTPSPIVPAVRRDTGAPVDLTFAALRSVSPVHLEYLANMGVRASMSISLVVDGALWGLISCAEHDGPRYVANDRRAACEILARLVSVQIFALEERERAAARDARRTTADALARAMSSAGESDDVLDPLVGNADLLAYVGADGAAVVHGDVVLTCGRVPSDAMLVELAAWLDVRGEHAPFATRSLATQYPAALGAKDVATGLLTFALPGSPRRRVMWFRPEVVQTVFWGGNPEKPARAEPHGRIHPRRSFEKWKEELRLRSRPWSSADLDAAEALRRRAVEIDLERQLARAHRAVRARDDLVAVVSHDLKSPLTVVQMQATLLLNSTMRAEDEPSRRLRAGAERIQRSVDRMNALITDLLDLAKIEAGRFELARRPEPASDVLVEAIAMVRPLANAKRITIDEEVSHACTAPLDRERIFQVLSNILGNAIKFTPDEGRIKVESQAADGELRVSISDTGPGVPEEERKHVFDRYWQAALPKRRMGSGLGLFIARGIVEAHGGRIWVERASTGGAKFTFTLPCDRA